MSITKPTNEFCEWPCDDSRFCVSWESRLEECSWKEEEEEEQEEEEEEEGHEERSKTSWRDCVGRRHFVWSCDDSSQEGTQTKPMQTTSRKPTGREPTGRGWASEKKEEEEVVLHCVCELFFCSVCFLSRLFHNQTFWVSWEKAALRSRARLSWGN